MKFIGQLTALLCLPTMWATAQAPCPDFSAEFAVPGGLPPSDCMLSFDDGSGPALFLGGQFSNFNGAGIDNIARWDGSTLQGLGSGVNGDVTSMCSFDDGSGAALIVSGFFSLAGGKRVANIAKWDGSSWSTLGAGLGSAARSMAAYDDGTGPGLYVGGDFSSAGGQTAYRLAKWQNGQWSQVDNGALHGPSCMLVWDDGTGPALYFGGSFLSIGPLASANGFAKLQGNTWTSLISGTKNGTVYSIVPFNDGSGPSFFLGGNFTTYNGVNAPGILRWRNGVISALSFGFQNTPQPSGMVVRSLALHDNGSGTQLYAGGTFDRSGPTLLPSVARWNGSFFQGLGAGLAASVVTLCSFDDGGGASLWAGGNISSSGTAPITGTVRWHSNSWSGISMGSGLNAEVAALRELDGPGGVALYAVGKFSGAGSLPGVNRIARWNGSQWSALGGGLEATPLAVEAFDSGLGRRIAAAGSFTMVSQLPAARVAQWDGSSWSALGDGFNGDVHALAAFDADGAGPGPELLIAAGAFTQTGSQVLMREISSWDGSSWNPLHQGLADGATRALKVVSLPNGTRVLYAGGSFNVAGSQLVHGIARWDGSTWSKVGGDVTGSVHAIASIDLGAPGGASIVIGGSFNAVHGVSADNVAIWDGVQWSALGSGLPDIVEALEVFDDGSGSGPRIYAGGRFTTAQGAPASYLARWDGAGWSDVGAGVNARVQALAVYDDGSLGRPSLFVGGNFSLAGGRSASYIARLLPCAFHTYCVAKLNSLGCTPVIEAHGTASASAASGFHLSVSQVLNNKSGLFLYGFSGSSLVPFQGGSLCVQPPLSRTVGVWSGGDPAPNDCSGVLAIDMNAFARGWLGGNPKPALSVSGSVVNCQAWSRDPGFAAPDATSLSDALEYTVGL